MSWTYDATQLSTSALYRVRLTLGDTDSNDPLLSDEEINYYLSYCNDDEQQTAYNCSSIILSKLARAVDYTLGPHVVNASQRYKQFKERHDNLSRSAGPLGGYPEFTDPERTVFEVDQMNNGTYIDHDDTEEDA